MAPRDYDTSTETSCLLPPTLWTVGYWNAHGENTGSDPTPGGFDVTYYLDGVLAEIVYVPATSDDFLVLNQVPGGSSGAL